MIASGEKITARTDHYFSVPENGLYAVTLAVRCRSAKQTQGGTGEDLRIEIDGRSFREIPAVSKPQYQDIPASWNGTQLKGAKKTIIFVLQLDAGTHTITFVPQEEATLEDEPRTRQIEDSSSVKFSLDEQAEDGDRKPWFTFVFIDLPLKTLSIDASARWHARDSDDIKLIIDGTIQRDASLLSFLHRNWLWSGSLFKKLLRRERRQVSIQTALPKDIHYIELWADRTPTLHNAIFDVGQIQSELRAKIVWESVVFRTGASDTANELAIISKNEQVAIIEKAVQGQRVKNSSGRLLSTNRWHRVRYKDREGYIYSLALEIDGEDKQSIRNIIAAEANAAGIDPKIITALADCESDTFPYTVSYDPDEPEVAFGIMQLTKKLLTDLNDESKEFYSPVEDVFDIRRNVRAGIRYFEHLYNARYGRAKDRLRKSVAAYNTGPQNVPVDGSFILEEYGGETRRLVPCVESHLRGITFRKAASYVKTPVAVLLGLVALLWLNEEFIAPTYQVLSEKNAADMHATAPARHKEEQIDFPAVVLDERRERLDFFNRNGTFVKQITRERLDREYSLRPPPEAADLDTLHIDSEVLESPDNVFYFFAATSYGCGANNCTWALYRFDVGQDNLEIVGTRISGWPTLSLSPDGSKIAVKRSSMAGICYTGSYLTIIELDSFKKNEMNIMDSRDDYGVNSIESLSWKDENHLLVHTTQYDQPGCPTDGPPKPPRRETRTVTVL